MKDLATIVYDILHGLVNLHKQGYTHMEVKWENYIIWLNVQGEWKWVIIDLEVVRWDGEEWEGNGLTTWDENALEDHDQKKNPLMH